MIKKTVLRRCCSCRKVLDRNLLFKITRDHKDGVVLKGGMGRSAYICPTKTCLEEAWKRKKLQKALRCQVQISIIKMLEDKLNRCNDANSEAILNKKNLFKGP